MHFQNAEDNVGRDHDVIDIHWASFLPLKGEATLQVRVAETVDRGVILDVPHNVVL